MVSKSHKKAELKQAEEPALSGLADHPLETSAIWKEAGRSLKDPAMKVPKILKIVSYWFAVE